MEYYLRSLGCSGDVFMYAELLELLGWYSADDLILAEPTLDDLFNAGIDSESDRLLIYKAVHPELTLEESPVLESGLVDDVLKGLDYTSALGYDKFDDESDDEKFEDLEKELERLQAEIQDLNVQTQVQVKEKEDDWLVVTHNSKTVPFNEQRYQTSLSYLEAGNTNQFILSIDGLEIDMQDPKTQNTCVLRPSFAFIMARATFVMF
eukprot:TRINITY_DN1992_c0_g1_i4.p1 TRINITY_DN1992_c0_g1~~TRINITY_DN1992_c0_g1_i4.p1  ORF type:complete len:230 (+),score=51.61 TRINITY_DN1992_c0_g1_i4:72-692(+)